MGFLHSVGKAVAGTLFAVFLALALTATGLVGLTNYDTLKPLASDMISQQLASAATTQQLSQVLDEAKLQCQGRSEITAPLQGIDVTVNCSDVLAAAPQDLPSLVAGNIVDQTVKKTYSCQPIGCLATLQGSDRLFYIFSSEFNSFLRFVVNMLWIAAAAAGAGYLFMLQGLANRLRGFGVTLIAVGIPYFITNFLVGGVLSMLEPSQAASVQPVVVKMLGQISGNFLYAFIAGVVLLVAGIIAGLPARKKK